MRRVLSRTAAPARVTGSQPGKMGRLSQASRVDDARVRTPTGIATGRCRLQTFSISSICAPSGAATQHTCRPLLKRSSRICAPFFLKFAMAPAFPLHGRAEIVDVELRDLLRILSGLDVDVPELHGHTSLLRLGLPKGSRGGPCRSRLGSTSRGTQPAFARFRISPLAVLRHRVDQRRHALPDLLE